MFSGVCRFLVFCDFECHEAPFWLSVLLQFGIPGPLKQHLKACNYNLFERFGHFGLSLLQVLIVGFKQMFVIWGCFDAPIVRPVGTNRCGRACSRKMENGSASHASKTALWVAGPLNQDNQTALSSGTLPRTRHECLAARWRISSGCHHIGY